MKNPKDTNPLDVAWDYYNRIVDEYAEKIFNEHIKPYMIKHNYTFSSGMGVWAVFKNNPKHNGEREIYKYNLLLDSDELPKYITKWLDMEIPGMPANSLGTIMPSYPLLTKNYK